jgi:hypothetical protein
LCSHSAHVVIPQATNPGRVRDTSTVQTDGNALRVVQSGFVDHLDIAKSDV